MGCAVYLPYQEYLFCGVCGVFTLPGISTLRGGVFTLSCISTLCGVQCIYLIRDIYSVGSAVNSSYLGYLLCGVCSVFTLSGISTLHMCFSKCTVGSD